jgi:hypothetical protein
MMSDRPDTKQPVEPTRSEATMAPGDEAPPGTPGTGDDVCPECAGSGRIDGRECANCLGRGRVVKAISAGP